MPAAFAAPPAPARISHLKTDPKVRILYIDIDSLRPDHLGCYGYHRPTSPHIDRVAAAGVRFENCYASDVPCLPSRTSFASGRFGIHHGAIGQGGTTAEIFSEGSQRGDLSKWAESTFAMQLRQRGLRTATISSFAEAHSAWHWYSGFHEMINTGRAGTERADEVSAPAIDWINRNGKKDDWFLHVNFWDPHTPYRTPPEFGDPFQNQPAPQWLTEEVRRQHWKLPGPHGAQEITGYDIDPAIAKEYPRQPTAANSMAEVKRMFDGYDTGIRYADEHIGKILATLSDLNVLDEMAILISADHGENLGELNVYGDHQTADHHTCRVPCILKWPGVKPGVDAALHYQFDVTATILQLLGGNVPPSWDAGGFATALKSGQSAGRPYLLMSQAAWACQRAVRFDDYLCIRTFHDPHHAWPDSMLFNVVTDPHEQHDLSDSSPDLRATGLAILEQWHSEMMKTTPGKCDPMLTVLTEGGGYYTRGKLENYLERLQKTGRADAAKKLCRKL
jgi:choline-sulfatase